MKRIISIALSAALGVTLCLPAYAATVRTTDTTSAVVTAALSDGILQFNELDACVKNGNSSVLACVESQNNLNNVNRKAVLDSLKKTDNALSNAIWFYSQNGADTTALKSSLSTIEDQIDDYSEENYAKSYQDSLLKINSSVNQIFKASESLYLNIVKMDYSSQGIKRKIDALSRSISMTMVQCNLGQASKEDLRALQTQYADLTSQMTSLQAQMNTAKQSLQSMIGVKPDGNLKIAAPDTVPSASIVAIDLPNDIITGKAACSAIYSNQRKVEDAKDDLDDMPFSPIKQHSYQQAVYTLSASKDSFEVQAAALYQSLLESQRQYKVSISDMESAQKTYAVSEKKYELGVISKQTLLNAQDTLYTAQQAVQQAALSLNSAFTRYSWVKLGISDMN